eukprot:360928-Chlamydomonas_euryale.AAC.6
MARLEKGVELQRRDAAAVAQVEDGKEVLDCGGRRAVVPGQHKVGEVNEVHHVAARQAGGKGGQYVTHVTHVIHVTTRQPAGKGGVRGNGWEGPPCRRKASREEGMSTMSVQRTHARWWGQKTGRSCRFKASGRQWEVRGGVTGLGSGSWRRMGRWVPPWL